MKTPFQERYGRFLVSDDSIEHLLNGYIEPLNGKMRDELLARETFYSLKDAQVLIEMWRGQYNTVRPHGALGYRAPRLQLR